MRNARTASTRCDRLAITRVLLAFAVIGIGRGAEVWAVPFMAGADVSSLPVHEDNGAVYRDGGQAGDAIDIFTDHGVNWFRLRLFVDPKFENNYNGEYEPFVAQDLQYTIALAERAKAAGAKVLLDFHYSDTWADPCHQWKPEAWRSLATMSELEQQVYDYTKQSIEAFKAAGVAPEMVQIGNEIASGLLWNGEYDDCRFLNQTAVGPNSGYPWTGGSNSVGFDRLATLLSAGINGARDGAGPAEEPLIMIHHDQGSRWDRTSDYFDRLLPRLQNNGTDVDVLGYSYYPKWHSGGMAGVEQNLNNSVAAYGKPVVVVEAGFASRCPSCEPEYEFEVSEQGQMDYLQALVDVVKDVPNDMGWGVFWWYAEARPTFGLPVWEGGRYGLFDQNGNILPAVDVFAALVPTALAGDYNDDGTVNAADYTMWRDNLDAPAGTLPNDVDGGVIGPAQYNTWRANYGSTLGSGSISSAAVPEPASVSLLLLAAVVAAMQRTGRSARNR